MILLIRKKWLAAAGLFILMFGAGFMLLITGHAATGTGSMNYRVFVAGVGTVDGKWCGQTGIAIIGLKTGPAAEKDMELKAIDLLVANQSENPLVFDPDIAIITEDGFRYGLKAINQQQVVIKPDTLSQGTVLISVPKGTKNEGCLLEIKGGNLKDGLILPLRVIKSGN